MCVYIFSDKRNARIISVKSGKLNVVNFFEEVIYRNVLIETLHGKNYENSENKKKNRKKSTEQRISAKSRLFLCCNSKKYNRRDLTFLPSTIIVIVTRHHKVIKLF